MNKNDPAYPLGPYESQISPRTTAEKVQLIMDLLNMTFKTGKRGRPRKLIKARDIKKWLKTIHG